MRTVIAQGTKVWIHAMGSYYAGEVTRLTPSRALVKYTSGVGKTREKWVQFDEASGKYINSKHETAHPLVLGSEPQPLGARQLARSASTAAYMAKREGR